MSNAVTSGRYARSSTPRAGRTGRRWARVPAYAAAGVYLRMAGGRVRNDAGRTLFVDGADPRARQLLLHRGAADRAAIRLWRAAVRALNPTAVLDVGANYGEVVLSAGYPRDCRVLCVEANRDVAGYLRRSLHAALPRAELTVAAASDRSGLPCVLHPGPNASSGECRALAATVVSSGGLYSTTCDELLGDVTDGRLVFKVDVEGGEDAVLTGLDRALGSVAAACGVVEFFHLDPATQLRLAEHHDLYAAPTGPGALLRLTAETLPAVFPEPHRVLPGYGKDAVLVAGAGLELLTGTVGGGPHGTAAGGG